VTDRYPIAPNGIFWSIQGEGFYLGVPMAFIRLAGCSVGCPQCDTDYRVSRRLTTDEVVAEVVACRRLAEWAWITGGEPTDHDLGPLATGLRREGFKVAIATSGVRPVPVTFDFLSVSPHDPARWKQRIGSELKLVPGLNGAKPDDFKLSGMQFAYRYVMPMEGDAASLAACLDWLAGHPDWRLTTQAHKAWGLS
jgi:7-carboxy-7-deazaguanine synthase